MSDFKYRQYYVLVAPGKTIGDKCFRSVLMISWNPWSASFRWTLLFQTSEDYMHENKKDLHNWFWWHLPEIRPWTSTKLYSEFIFPNFFQWLLLGWWINNFKGSIFWWHPPKPSVQVIASFQDPMHHLHDSTREILVVLFCAVAMKTFSWVRTGWQVLLTPSKNFRKLRKQLSGLPTFDSFIVKRQQPKNGIPWGKN
jgi:hypothetical protein